MPSGSPALFREHQQALELCHYLFKSECRHVPPPPPPPPPQRHSLALQLGPLTRDKNGAARGGSQRVGQVTHGLRCLIQGLQLAKAAFKGQSLYNTVERPDVDAPNPPFKFNQ